MRLRKLHKVKKLVKDPFMLAIAAVVMVPGLLVAYGIAHQSRPQAAVNSVSQSSSLEEGSQSLDSSNDTKSQKSVTEAEKPMLEGVPEPDVVPVSTLGSQLSSRAPVCDHDQQQAAEAARSSAISQEKAYHQKEQNRLRLITVVYRGYWEQEVARYEQALDKIEAAYQKALAAANC